MKRKNSIALLDPIERVAYSRPVRKNNAGYREDSELQALVDDKGLERAKHYAIVRYQGVVIAVMV